MTQSLSLSLVQRQELNLRQIIALSSFLAAPIGVVDSVLSSLSSNPSEANQILLGRKREHQLSGGGTGAVWGFLHPAEGNVATTRNGGFVIYPDLEVLVKLTGTEMVLDASLPDVLYRGVKNDKPKIFFADALSPQAKLETIQIPAEFGETRRLYNWLIKNRAWVTEKLRAGYTLLGEKQREFMATLEPTKLHPCSYKDLAEYLKIDASTVSRLLKNKIVEIQSADGRSEVHPAWHLTPTVKDYKRHQIVQEINRRLLEERTRDRPYNDDELATTGVARRTISKYRNKTGIPTCEKRKTV